VDVDQSLAEAAAKGGDDLLRLAEAHEAVIDKDRSQLVADGAVDQSRGDRGIDASREAADDSPIAHFPSDFRYCALNVAAHRPCRLALAYINEEVANHLAAPGRVSDLGVKLD